jgi:YfiH family protein
MELPPEALVTLHQVHSARAIPVTGALPARPEADAMVTATPGVLLAVLTADCQPVLFHDSAAGVSGAAHAGWRGALDGVLEATLAAMEGLGAKRAATVAVIGPTISQAAYEVGPEFLDRFRDESPDNTRFFTNGPGDRLLFDLPGYGLYRLRAAGIGHAEWTGHCTYRDPERFYSYRRTTHAGEADYGRLISTIRL